MSTKPRTAARRVFATALGTVVALVLLEAGLRITDALRGTYTLSDDARRARSESPWMASTDVELVYVHRPMTRAEGELKIESHGVLRPVDVAPRKRDGSVRIAVIGDSIGAALSLRYEDRFPAALERRLGAGGVPSEVLNFCVNGYDTVQEARLLETSVAPLAPDAVLLVYCLNDPAESVTPLGWFREQSPPPCRAWAFLSSALGGALGRPAGRPLAPGAGPIGPAASTWRRMYDPGAEPWQTVTRGLDRVAAWSATTRVPVLVAVAPLLDAEDPAGESTRGFREQVAAAIAARRLAAVDLQSAVAAHPLADVALSDGDIYHFGARGHAILADALVPAVRRLVGR
ncbi:MAG: hypothetical protein K8T90_10730 [Planctomycetes bacterium]|nr:hypothetical protein [Planctomycetota bacterium]